MKAHRSQYTYYTLSALAVPVPLLAKRALTTLQIAQFVVGASYAVLHLFIAYRVPVETPYRFVHNLSTALPGLASTATSAASTALASGDPGAWARKLALRAAGMEGLAQQATNRAGQPFGVDAVHAAQVERAAEEIRYRAGHATIDCIDTSGQAFAILLNVMYLAPLTGLFVRFFIRAYSRRARLDPKARGGKPAWQPEIVGPSAGDAAKKVESAVLRAMSRDRGSERGSAYTSPSTSEAENGGVGKRRKGLEMTRPEDEDAKTGKKGGDEAEVKEEPKTEEADGPKENGSPETPEGKEDAQAESTDDKEGAPAESPDDKAEPEAKNEGKDDEDGRSFAQYTASADKGGENGAAKTDEAETEEAETKEAPADAKAYEANVDDLISEEEKEQADAEMQKGPEDSGVLVDKEQKEGE